jgi:hypothetical protein
MALGPRSAAPRPLRGGGPQCATAAPRRAGPRAPPRTRRAAAATAGAPSPAAAFTAAAPAVVAGAGLAGLSAALALHRAGFAPLVLERAPALRGEGSAIALWSNAWRALDALGVGDKVRAGTPLLERFELVRSSGRRLRAFDITECDAACTGGEAAEFRGVTRGALLRALAGGLPDGALRFGVGVEGVEAAAGPGGAGREHVEGAGGRTGCARRGAAAGQAVARTGAWCPSRSRPLTACRCAPPPLPHARRRPRGASQRRQHAGVRAARRRRRRAQRGRAPPGAGGAKLCGCAGGRRGAGLQLLLFSPTPSHQTQHTETDHLLLPLI